MEGIIRQVIVLVSDMDRSVEFYRDALGLREVTVSDDWSEFDAGGTTIALHPGKRPTGNTAVNGADAGTVHISFLVTDVAEAVQDLRSHGIEVDGPKTLEGMEGLFATFSDPDGLSLGLEAEQPASQL